MEKCTRIVSSVSQNGRRLFEVPLPKALTLTDRYDLVFTDLRGSLAVIEEPEPLNFRVWMTKPSGQLPFTRMYSIHAPIASISRLLGFRESGGLLFLAKTDVDESNIVPNELPDPVAEHNNLMFPRKAYPYSESLLLLNNWGRMHEAELADAAKQPLSNDDDDAVD
ncbi:hypothetical protein L1987_82062 [Smallanthus sonchifolius]|uniref:Uncharacterized protein n=1 Tax=Smallanthus sonchifolius TaxID=185202 RepID=A0ACB8YTE7_9ASTR|nr:hypothetical protein L1987_82062 [Smallanthus sonchifolius]